MGSSSEAISIVDRGLTVDGVMSAKGKLIIKGTVKGELTGSTLIIAEEGAVYADTKAGNITIGGKFEGSLNATNELAILSTGSCVGKVLCKDLVVEAGGILNGEVTYITDQKPKPEKPAKGTPAIKK